MAESENFLGTRPASPEVIVRVGVFLAWQGFIPVRFSESEAGPIKYMEEKTMKKILALVLAFTMICASMLLLNGCKAKEEE